MLAPPRGHARLPLAVGLLLATLTCNYHGLIPVDEVIEAERQEVITQLASNAIDILWVIDNSISMCQEQEALTENFDRFVEGLSGVNADFHIGVTSTDMSSDAGRLRTRPGDAAECTTEAPPTCPEVTGPILRASNYGFDPENPDAPFDTEQLRQDFRCIATVGSTSRGDANFEKGLEAMTAALSVDLAETANAGFRRDGAWLLIVFVADENDCSDGGFIAFERGQECEWLRDDLIPTATFVDFLMTLPGTGSGELILVAGIIGPDNGVRVEAIENPRPSCTQPDGRGDAFAGYRYEEVIEAFGERGAVASICQANFGVALDQITSVVRENLAVRCLEVPPPTCQFDTDCRGDATCLVRGGSGGSGGLALCSDFEIVIEVQDESGEWVALRGDADPDPQFIVRYGELQCAVGIEFTTGNQPGAGAVFRIRYPIVVDANAAPGPRADADN